MRNNNMGTTLVEVTVGFLMLAIILTSFIKIIKLSSDMTINAINTEKNNMLFEQKYYSGYNYSVNDTGTLAFRTDMDLTYSDGSAFVIELNELTKNGDYFKQLKLNNSGIFERDKNQAYINVISISNASIKIIENVKDMNISRKKIFRYYYTE